VLNLQDSSIWERGGARGQLQNGTDTANHRADVEIEQLLRTANSELAISRAGIAPSSRRQRPAARREPRRGRRPSGFIVPVPASRKKASTGQGSLDLDDEAELDDIYETERRLLYVACTRAREHLLLTGVTPVSEYLADLEAKAG
jgi:hypothetical protein